MARDKPCFYCQGTGMVDTAPVTTGRHRILEGQQQICTACHGNGSKN